jgi:hypothetical protein
MKVLIACEESGVVRDAFIALGHDAMSCDLLPTRRPGPHHQGDVLPLLEHVWDLVIAHPPCTRLCNSGVRWLAERNLWAELDQAVSFFMAFMECKCERVAIENPIMHRYAAEKIGPPTQYVQPHYFGDNQSKRTGLWLRGLPPLTRTHHMPPPYGQDVHKCPPGPMRARIRSETFSGFAGAMANQWGGLK